MDSGRHPPARSSSRTRGHRRRHSIDPRQLRLLVRLLTQMERVLAINGLETLSVDVLETARENLVIGQA